MSKLKLPFKIPEGYNLKYIPIDLAKKEDPLSCSFPIDFELSKKKSTAESIRYLVVSFPGAFTPTCLKSHVPEFLKTENIKEILINKNIDKLLFISSNDSFVLQAFGKILLENLNLNENEKKLIGDGKKIIFASDPSARLSKLIGFYSENEIMGTRTGRYAMIVKDGVIVWLAGENKMGVDVSGWDKVKPHL